MKGNTAGNLHDSKMEIRISIAYPSVHQGRLMMTQGCRAVSGELLLASKNARSLTRFAKRLRHPISLFRCRIFCLILFSVRRYECS